MAGRSAKLRLVKLAVVEVRVIHGLHGRLRGQPFALATTIVNPTTSESVIILPCHHVRYLLGPSRNSSVETGS